MLRGLYSAATAMDAATTNHEVISQNLAHVNVPGYRRSILSNETFETRLQNQLAAGSGGNLGTRVSQVVTDFQMGPMQQTGRSLDVALASPDAFFVLDGPNGPLYTRTGVFHVGQDGSLINSTGVPIRGTGGPIILPENASAQDVQIGTDGSVHYDGVQLGQLEVVEFTDQSQLIRAGTNSFEAPPDLVAQPSTAAVAQGMRESSNVSAVDEMVRMIAGMRYFEASQRAMRTLGETIHEHTNPQAG